jgi:transcriptional regulator with XRE-family HTH domain
MMRFIMALSVTDQNIDRNGFAERLKSALPNDKTLQESADAIGISLSGLKNWLKAVSEPNVSNLLKISEYTGASVKWLVSGETDQPTQGDLATPVVGAGDHHAGYQDEPPFNSAVMERVIVAYMEWLAKYTTNDRSGPEHDAGAITAIYRVVIKDFIEEGTIQLDAVKSRVNIILNYLSENS